MGYQRDSRYILTEGDIAIFEKAKQDGRFFAEYYFGKELFAWQAFVHHAAQPEITIVGGFGCGKTGGIAMSACIHSTMTPGFKFMNVADVAWISHQMLLWISENLQETEWWNRFVYKYVERPYPKIVVEYVIPAAITGDKDYIVRSSMEFMSASDDGKRLLSWEGDWVHIDEAGLILDLDGLITSVGSRLRGNFQGRPRMGRLSMTSNSWENLDMWDRFDQMELDPTTYLSLKLSTRDNPTLTEDQITDLKRRITDGNLDRWLDGDRPPPEGKEFSGEAVEASKMPDMDALMQHFRDNYGKKICKNCNTGNDSKRGLCINCGVELPSERFLPDFSYSEAKKAGIVNWALPYDPSCIYMIVGDPGQGNPPKRNAPVIMVLDVTHFLEDKGRALVVAFWWGFGNGKYEPFVDQYMYWKARYQCMQAVFDSTGTQQSFETMFNILEEEMVYGYNLSATNKAHGLVALKLILENNKLGYPGEIKGISYQLGAFRMPDTKIDQDIVSALLIAALWLRGAYFSGIPKLAEALDSGVDRLTDRYLSRSAERYNRRES